MLLTRTTKKDPPLSLILPILFCLLTTVKASTYTSEFATCASTAYIPNQPGISATTASSSDCSNFCYTSNPTFIYSAWVSTTRRCSCGSNSFPTASVVTGNAGGCGANYEVSITHTTYDFHQCTNSYTVDTNYPYIQSSSTNFYSIFNACKSYGIMAIYPTSGNTFLYLCGTSGYQLTGPQLTCGYQVNRIYFHPADATASGLVRKSNNEKRRIGSKAQGNFNSHWYPKGLTPCQLENDSTSFECIDTNHELESCGGCVHGLYAPTGNINSTLSTGTDCSSIPGVSWGHSSCIEGTCKFDCRKGWNLQGDKCVKE